MMPLKYDPLSDEFEIVLTDALTLFVQAKIADSDLRLDRFLQDYFRKVKLGEHVFQKNYAFVSGTDHNRKMFIQLLWKTFHHLAFVGDKLHENDYHNLLLLICPTFPKSIVGNAFEITGKTVDGRIGFNDFIFSFQFCFYYDKCRESLKNALSFPEVGLGKDKLLVELKSVYSNYKSSPKFTPKLQAITSALGQHEFYDGWPMVQDTIAKFDGINNEVGVLPLRSTMFDQESLRSIIPSDWITRKSIQPNFFGFPAQSSSSQPEPHIEKSTSLPASMGKLSTSNSKLLKRPSRQIKLPNQSQISSAQAQSNDTSGDGNIMDDNSSVASGGRPTQKFVRKSRLPQLKSSSNQRNIIHNIVDEESSSDEDHSSQSTNENNNE